MAVRKRPDNAPEERLEADRRQLELLAAQCGEEAGLHRPLNDVTGGVITGIPEDTDLAQALSDRETTDILVHLLDQNREQVERALERLHVGRVRARVVVQAEVARHLEPGRHAAARVHHRDRPVGPAGGEAADRGGHLYGLAVL